MQKPIDQANMDKSVDPGNDFYQYATGGWQQNNPLTAEYSRYGTFDQLQEENNKQVKTLITELQNSNFAVGSPEQIIGNFYAAGMDSVAIDAQGIKAITPYLLRINNITSLNNMQEVISELHMLGVHPFFVSYSTPDRKNSDWVILGVSQAGLGMGERDYYLDNDQRTRNIREAYITYIAALFVLSGHKTEQANVAARQVLDFETRLASVSMSRLDQRDPQLTYNKMSVDELARLSALINWQQYFSKLGIEHQNEINVGQTEYMKALPGIVNNTALGVIKNYLTFTLLNKSASYLTSDFVDAKFTFYGKTMSGKEKIRPRWKRMVDVTNNAMGEVLGQVYVKKYFPPEAKQRMEQLVENLRKAFANRINKLEWMSDTTKLKALEKLTKMRVKVGYPNMWRDFSGLKLNSEFFIQNVFEANTFNIQYNLAKIGKPVDKGEWLMLPHTVNAYYHPLHNEIVFPAGILQPPFFYQKADDAVNYGAIGMVIGHEMTHGFDDKGRQFDSDGNLNDWWTKADEERFNTRTQVLEEQYNAMQVVDSVYADGKLTLGENIADLGGLNIAFDAFKMTTQYKNKQNIDGYTPAQRFYLAYANVWAQNVRDEEKLRRVKEDVHSLGKHRVNGPLMNIAEFYQAFDVEKENEMYTDDSLRAKIW